MSKLTQKALYCISCLFYFAILHYRPFFFLFHVRFFLICFPSSVYELECGRSDAV